MAKNKINITKINRAIRQAADATVERLSHAYDEALTDEVWEWDGTTYRRNGDVVDSPRDVVDTGKLFDSKVIRRRGDEAQFEWTADHAAIVHDGATTRDGKAIPARPWTDLAHQRFNAAKFMSNQMKRHL